MRHVLTPLALLGFVLIGCEQPEGSSVMAEIERQEAEAQAERAVRDGEKIAFLDEQAKRPGAAVTDSGLVYEVVRDVAGDRPPRPSAEDVVTVHYEGTLRDGTVFDSSYQRGEPAEFPLNGVIPGWTEGVQLMQPGEEFRFVIPAELAYGARGAPPSIGPNEPLVFRVELLSFRRSSDGTVVRP